MTIDNTHQPAAYQLAMMMVMVVMMMTMMMMMMMTTKDYDVMLMLFIK